MFIWYAVFKYYKRTGDGIITPKINHYFMQFHHIYMISLYESSMISFQKIFLFMTNIKNLSSVNNDQYPALAYITFQNYQKENFEPFDP